MSKCPNFILYITDQHRADFLSCYGHPILKTPNAANVAGMEAIGCSAREAQEAQALTCGMISMIDDGVKAAFGMEGQDLSTSSREHAFIQYSHQKQMQGLEWGELYDLDVDPGELQNLWDNPDYKVQRASLIERLARSKFTNVETAPAPISRA